MKVSLNLVKYFNQQNTCAPDPYSYGVENIIKRIGAQLGAIEEVIYSGRAYDGVVVVKVVSCENHPNADKLHVCLIDDSGVVKDVPRNGEGYVQVVCGAPNVREGLTVAWLPPGSTVPATVGKEPFVLGARELRGVMSNGMLASAHELGISEDHSGILEIKAEDVGEENCKPGTPFKQLYGLDDVIIDCENKMFTHRPDCFGTLGVAREIAGIFGDSFTSPDWYDAEVQSKKAEGQSKDSDSLTLRVENNAKQLVPRFMCQLMSDVKVEPSPLWLQSYLSRIGSRPISNIVDYSNYLMMLLGQPTHAFDYDKVKKLSSKEEVFGPRMARKGETLKLLNGKEVALSEDDIVIAYGDTAVALAGIMGGADTEVDANTKNIIIECATFDLYAVRRTTMRLGVFSDAATRYTKGQSPWQNASVLAKMVADFEANGTAVQASEAYDVSGQLSTNKTVQVSTGFINERLGTELETKQIKTLLENVECSVKTTDDQLEVTAPFWRMDIELPEDVVEEVGRLYGYDKVDVRLPLRPSKAPAKNKMRELANVVRATLSGRGANEVLGYSFVHGDLLTKAGQDPKKAFHLRNAISPDLQYYRLSIVPTLLEKVYTNVKNDAGKEDNAFALYEINKIHMIGQLDKADHDLPKEDVHVALVFAADDKVASKRGYGSAYYQAKHYLEMLLPGESLNLVPLHSFDFGSDEWGRQLCAPFEPKRSGVIVRDGIAWGVVGEFKASVGKALKLPACCAGFEVGLEVLKSTNKSYRVLPTYPKTTADITLELSATYTFAELIAVVAASIKTHGNGLFLDYTCRDIFKADGQDQVRYTIRFTLASYDHTLTTEEANAFVDAVSAEATTSLSAKRI